jgi:hypothetical protein
MTQAATMLSLTQSLTCTCTSLAKPQSKCLLLFCNKVVLCRCSNVYDSSFNAILLCLRLPEHIFDKIVLELPKSSLNSLRVISGLRTGDRGNFRVILNSQRSRLVFSRTVCNSLSQTERFFSSAIVCH